MIEKKGKSEKHNVKLIESTGFSAFSYLIDCECLLFTEQIFLPYKCIYTVLAN